MSKAKPPSVLILDDHQEGNDLKALLRRRRVSTKILHPEQVTLADLVAADLVLVDYELDNWPERTEHSAPISRQPRDGLALSSMLRRHVHDREKESPTAFAILTGKIQQLAAPLPPEHREHVLARICNLEWVFQKSTPGGPYLIDAQIAELAAAVRKLPKTWLQTDDGSAVRQLAVDVLNIDPDNPRNGELMENVAACIPPVHELSAWSHGLTLLRWLLHRILPYPCFLWDSYYLAARLHVDHAWFMDSFAKRAGLRRLLNPCKYTGILSEFVGPRWWRSSIELSLWDITKGESFNTDSVWTALSRATRQEIKRSSPSDHPIVVVDQHFRRLEQFASIDDSVRISPDDWPPYADQPWTTIRLAKQETRLGSLVISEDRGKLDGRGK